jgi:hypothetical protein
MMDFFTANRAKKLGTDFFTLLGTSQQKEMTARHRHRQSLIVSRSQKRERGTPVRERVCVY